MAYEFDEEQENDGAWPDAQNKVPTAPALLLIASFLIGFMFLVAANASFYVMVHHISIIGRYVTIVLLVWLPVTMFNFFTLSRVRALGNAVLTAIALVPFACTGIGICLASYSWWYSHTLP